MDKKVVILLVLVLVLTGCASQAPASNKSFDSLDYEVKECTDKGTELLDINVDERAIQVHQ
ncbi:MAG: hypothetical protein KAQ83_04685, partial [Nanoarchaeota archaeon]|nr:hypothetical protein [Nanoarchaeota archaeon]